MLAVLAILALAVSGAATTTTKSCPCSQQQGHEQPQQPHPQEPHQQQPHPQQPPHQQQWHGQQQHQWQTHQQPQQPWYGQQQCQQGEQQRPQGGYAGSGSGSYSANLSQCREFLRQQCSPAAMPFLQSRVSPPSRCQVLRRKCCQQLKQVEPQYCQQAIYDMVLSIMEQQPQEQEQQGGYQQGAQGQTMMAMVEAAQMVLQLPAMCGLHQPGYGTALFGMAGGAYQASYGTSPFGMASGAYQPSYGSSPFDMAAGGTYQTSCNTSPFGMAGGGVPS